MVLHQRPVIYLPELLQQPIKGVHLCPVQWDMKAQPVLPPLHVKVLEAGQLFRDVLLEVKNSSHDK